MSMPFTAVIMPKFEMTQETGKVAAWLKAEGDHVEKGEAILEVETDKVNMEVEAPAAGILTGIAVKPGEIVPIGWPIAYIVKPGEAAAPAASPQKDPSTAFASEDAHSAQDGSGQNGSAQDDRPARPSVGASPLAARLAESLGIDLAQVQGTGPRGQVTRKDIECAMANVECGERQVTAAPAARRLARELGVDLHQVHGTGPGGRIQSDDVRTFASRAPLTGDAAPAPSTAFASEDAHSAQDGSAQDDLHSTFDIPTMRSIASTSPRIRRLVPLTNIRRTIAERMTQSVREAPQFTVEVDVDMGRAMAIVQDFRDGASQGPKVTITALLVKACAWALAQFPIANSMFEADHLVEWAEINIGVATAIEQGLIVPVVHNADCLGMQEIAARLTDLTTRARDNRLKLEDLQGGTFTISNLGMFGADRFSAILNPPQAAILAVGRVAKRAMVSSAAGAAPADDRIEVRQMATLALTADHRVLDGAAGAQFLALIQRALEHPGLLLG